MRKASKNSKRTKKPSKSKRRNYRILPKLGNDENVVSSRLSSTGSFTEKLPKIDENSISERKPFLSSGIDRLPKLTYHNRRMERVGSQGIVCSGKGKRNEECSTSSQINEGVSTMEMKFLDKKSLVGQAGSKDIGYINEKNITLENQESGLRIMRSAGLKDFTNVAKESYEDLVFQEIRNMTLKSNRKFQENSRRNGKETGKKRNQVERNVKCGLHPRNKADNFKVEGLKIDAKTLPKKIKSNQLCDVGYPVQGRRVRGCAVDFDEYLIAIVRLVNCNDLDKTQCYPFKHSFSDYL